MFCIFKNFKQDNNLSKQKNMIEKEDVERKINTKFFLAKNF